jgi:hypothetical protein
VNSVVNQNLNKQISASKSEIRSSLSFQTITLPTI